MKPWTAVAVLCSSFALSTTAWATPALTLTPDGACYHVNDTVTVTVDLSDGPAAIVGGQFFLSYNASKLTFVSAEPAASVWTRQIFEAVNSVNGTIDYAVGIPNGGAGAVSGTMAVLTFTAAGEICDTAGLVSFRAHTPPTRIVDVNDAAYSAGTTLIVNHLSPVSIDSSAPTATNLVGEGDVTIECDDTDGLDDALAFVPGFTDNCTVMLDADEISDVTTPDNECPHAYVRVRTWTATDDCGNTSAAYVQTITVVDTTAPVATNEPGAGDVLLECDDLEGYALALSFEPSFLDGCSGKVAANLVFDDVVPDEFCANGFVHTRIWTGMDDCDNTSDPYVHLITVVDTTAPVATTAPGAGDDTLECDDAAGLAAVLAFVPVFTDNCTASVMADLESDVTTPDAECPNAYVRVRTWTASDGCGNTSSAYEQAITVVDTTAPVAATAPGAGDVTLECDDAAGLAAGLAFVPVFTDNCSASVTADLESDVTTPDAECPNAYVRVRTWTADDGCGNTSAAYEQTITVVDTTAPVATTAPGAGDVTLECDDAAGLAAALAFVPAFGDNSTASVTADLASDVTTPDNDCPNAYVRVRTWTASDGCGNTSGGYTQSITVGDTTPPVITPPDDIEINADESCTAEVSFSATAEDACDGPTAVVYKIGETTIASPHVFQSGTTVVTVESTDSCGNLGTDSFSVTVVGCIEIRVDVQLQGVNEPVLTRCITFELIDCLSEPFEISQEIQFSAGLATNVPLVVPFGSYDCITARDRLHTLRRTAALEVDEFSQYTADFTGDPATGGDWLIGGNLNADEYIDIIDFGVFVNRFGVNYGTGDTNCNTSPFHADISGNGMVLSEDYTFIQINFLETDEALCCAPLPIGDGGPIRDITLAELGRKGMGHLAAADLDRNGRLNQQDIVAFMLGARPQPAARPPSGRQATAGKDR